MRNKIFLSGIITILLITSLTACGKNKTEETEENTTEVAIETQTKATALKTTVNDDGSKTEEMSDGSTVVIDTEGNVTVTTAEGEVKEMTTEEYVAYQEEVALESPAITPGGANNTDTPNAPEQKPEAPVDTPAVDEPQAPVKPNVPVTPETPVKPEVPVTPVVPDTPVVDEPEVPEAEHGVKTGTVTVKINWYYIDGTVGFVDTQVCDIDAYGDIVGDPQYTYSWGDPTHNPADNYIICGYFINDSTCTDWRAGYASNEGASIKKFIDNNYEMNMYPQWIYKTY